jgi:hypothetical protein
MASRVLTALGVAVLAFGVGGLVVNADVTVPSNWALYVLGGLALHDGLLIPLVAVGGVVLARLVPARLRPPVQGGFIVSASLLLVAIPPWTGRGALPGNDSLLPQDYGPNLLIVLGVVWALVAVLVALRAARHDPPAPPVPLPASRGGW